MEHSRSPRASTSPDAVSEQLDLDMAWPLDVALAEDAVVAEGGCGLPPRGGERLLQLVGGPNDAHAASAATRGRLDDEREADVVRLAVRDDGNAGLAGDLLRGELVAAAGAARRPKGRRR